MEYDHGPAGHSIRQRNKDSRRYLLKYHRTINEKELGDCHRVRAEARDTYARDLCLSQRIRYVHAYLLAKIWYMAQMFPAPMTCTRQLNTAIAWYIWKEAIFRVPLSTSHRPKKQGGWSLINIGVKCRALLIGRMWLQSLKNGSATATLLQEWKLAGSRANPPNVGRIPTKLEYLYQYALDTGYIVPPANDEPLRTFKQRVYSTLYIMAAAVNESRGMRITQRHPDTNWKQVWKNLHTARLAEETKSLWYTVVHVIVPTNERLHAIRLVESDLCRHCDRQDTLIHRLTVCNDGLPSGGGQRND